MLGIDTGGTYTDAVVVDRETGRVLGSAKALTTHDELSRGIDAAIAALLDGADPHVDLARIGLVGLSTTLATNALVEGKGGRVGLILIGYDPPLIERWGFRRELVTDQVIFVQGGHGLSGRETAPLDEAAIREAAHRHTGQVDAWAISGYFGVRNPDHEQRARDLVRAISGLPVTCAHELTGELNAIRRATTVALNARLIPLIQNLIQAVQRSLARHRIPATLMIVRGDGALLRASVALEHPVETILSGPAASIVGARCLTGLDEAIVVDMGGTTTDIAVLADGRPGIRSEGARVGGWRTLVRAVDAQTTGLGGDSHVRLVGGRMQIGPERAIPLAMAAALHPRAAQELRRSLRQGRASRNGASDLFVLMGAGQSWELTETERQIVDALSIEPLSLDRLAERAPRARLYLTRPNRLTQHGLVRRASFTPTDALHVEGSYRAWDADVAQMAAASLGEQMGLSATQVSQLVRERVVQLLAVAILNRVISLHDGPADVMDSPASRLLIEQALSERHAACPLCLATGQAGGQAREAAVWPKHLAHSTLGKEILRSAACPGGQARDSAQNDMRGYFQGRLPDLDIRLRLRRPIVALGAPAPAYFDQVAGRLGAELVLPEHVGVANAIGAVSGSVMHTCEMRVAAQYDATGITGYTLHSPAGFWQFDALDDALAFARERGREEAIRGAYEAGATDIQVEEEASEERAVSAIGGEVLYLGTQLRFTAAGRPDLGKTSEAFGDFGSLTPEETA